MKKLLLLPIVAGLLFSIACGYGGSGATPVGVGAGNFSNANLSGQYVYQLSGTDFSSGVALPYREAGIFSADGNGHITTGTDDFCESSTCLSASAVTGSYTVGKDGTGLLSLNTGTNLSITLAGSSKAYLIETDPTLNAAGIAEMQTASALSTVPSGTFIFRMHTISTQSASLAGVITITGGAVTGSDDVERGGVFDNNMNAPLTLTGSFGAPASNGRGTASVTDSANITSDFIYYIVDGNNLRFLSTDAGILGLGRAEKQTGTPFSMSSLSGGYAFGSQADDNTYLAGINTVGSLTAAGNGTISAGSYDSVHDGSSSVNVSFSGTDTMSTNGRATVTLNVSGGATIQQVFWMVSPSRAFFLTNDSTKVEDGTADRQQASSFSNSTVNGQYAFVMDGFNINANTFVDRVGWVQGDGSGVLKWNEVVNNSGAVQSPGILSGTYSVSSNGRATGTVSNLSSNLVFYMVSGSRAYILQNDAGVEIMGSMNIQP